MLGENLTQRPEVSFFSTRLVCGVVWAALETHSSLERASEPATMVSSFLEPLHRTALHCSIYPGA